MMRLLAALFIPIVSYAAVGGAEIARGLREVELDPAECYRVHELQINKDDVHLYFTDGYLIFGRPVNGARTTAVFTTEVEAGDAELLLLPPTRSERRSLARYTGSPNMDEHLTAAILLFGDDTYGSLIGQIRANEFNKRSEEMGALMPDQWNPWVSHLSQSLSARRLLDLLSPAHRRQGCFVAAIHGKKLDNFHLVYDPLAPHQIYTCPHKTQ